MIIFPTLARHIFPESNVTIEKGQTQKDPPHTLFMAIADWEVVQEVSWRYIDKA